MKNSRIFMICAFVIVILSVPLGNITFNLMYTNVATEVNSLLSGFINSYLVIGIFVFLIGILNNYFVNKK